MLNEAGPKLLIGASPYAGGGYNELADAHAHDRLRHVSAPAPRRHVIRSRSRGTDVPLKEVPGLRYVRT